MDELQTVYFNLNDDLTARLEWTVVSQSPSTNSTTIAYSIIVSCSDRTPNDYVIEEVYLAIDNEIALERYDADDGLFGLNRGQSAIGGTGTYTIEHYADGTKTADVFLLLGGEYANAVEVEDFAAYDSVQEMVLPTIERKATIITAPNFTDEENPVITYSNPAGSAATKVEACISFTGGNADIPYREISKTGTKYTFVLTEDERNTLRMATLDNPTKDLRFYLKTTIAGKTYFSYVTRTFTVVNSNPILNNPTIKENKEEVLALTGSEDTLIRHISMAEFSFEPVAVKGATITSQSVKNGNQVVSGLSQGIIQDVESGTFIFSATDCRGLTTTATVEKNLIEYIKPTCYQTVTIEMSGETGAKVNLEATGDYFNRSFGAADNTIKVEVRHTQNDGSMGDWLDLTPFVTDLTATTYKLTATISGLNYDQAYTFQCRITDRFYTVESASYTVKLLPVFDWDDDEFNFNVPVTMNNKTVLRHNKDANNTVLSASGGHIYLRPNGTNSTRGEVKINPDGDITLSGKLYDSDGNEITSSGESENVAADYVIETGSVAMGSNGTWYWEKWNSGKAVCYGCRNYGKMAVTTSSTVSPGEYESSLVIQTFPSGLFNSAPLVTTANLACHIDWDDRDIFVARSVVTDSQLSLRVLCKTSRTLPSSYISINAIGRWK